MAPVDLAALWVLGELFHVTGEDVVVGKPKQDVVELEVGVDESALDVQEVKSLEGVLEDLLGEGDGEVTEHAPRLFDVARRRCQQKALVAAAPGAHDGELARGPLQAPQAGVGGGGGAAADELEGSLFAGISAGVFDANF